MMDHKNDTDDVVEDVNFINIVANDHGNDTEDVPDGLDPVLLLRN